MAEVEEHDDEASGHVGNGSAQASRDASRLVDERCRSLGFALWGICDATASEHGVYLERFADEGRSGTMGWLADTLRMRSDVQSFVPGARSVIAVADVYVGEGGEGRRAGQQKQGAKGTQSKTQITVDALLSPSAPQPLSPLAPPAGKVARYAHGRDYHKVMKKRLHALCDVLRERFPGETFRATVDTAPLHEREHAARAGLGWIGKNTLLIHPRHGSYLLRGCVVSTLRIEPMTGSVTSDATTSRDREGVGPMVGSAMLRNASVHRTSLAHFESNDVSPPRSLTVAARGDALAVVRDHCANCTRCIDACPTGAIDAGGYSMDPRRCISYLTIEHDGDIPRDVNISGWIAGCDICQEVCPYNTIADKPSNRLALRDDYAPRAHAAGLSLRDVLQWTEDDRLKHTSGTALTRIKLPQWKRNAGALLAAHEKTGE